MADLKTTLTARQAVTMQQAKLILDTCEREGRALTAEEKKELKELEASVDGTTKRLGDMQANDNINAEINRLTGGMAHEGGPTGNVGAGQSGGRPVPGASIGRQFVQTDAMKWLQDHRNNRAGAWSTPSVELSATTVSEDAGSGGPLALPDQQPGILPLATRRLVVAGLIAPGTTTSTLVSFMKEKTFTNAAAPVAEGGTKPESTLVFENATSKVEKIAHWIPVTDEILQDVAQMSSYIDGRMRHGVDLAEDDELLNGSGVSPHLKGFLHLTTPAAPIARVAETNADVILKQISAIELATMLEVSGIVLNPAQWLAILLTKDSTGNYIGGSGPFATPRQPTLWGRPVAVTPVIPAGTALVGAFQSGAQLFKHGGLRVDVSNTHADFFIKNLIAVRAEIREALAVYRESAFGLVTNLT